MTKFLSTVALFLIMQLFLYGQVSTDTIKAVAKNFYSAKVKAFQTIPEKDIAVSEIFSVGNQNSKPDYYIVNMSPKGFVIIANEYSSIPVIAYSFEDSYDKNAKNTAFDWWMNHRSKEIQALRSMKLPANAQWKQYMNKQSIKSTKSVAPLVITKWDQGKYYNSACPADPNGLDGHCVTGCVATAVSQLMYYHRWPLTGTGSYSYTLPDYGVIEASFDTCHYDYNEMTPILTNYNYAASLLLYTTGITFDMDYGPDGSAVWNHSVANSMKTYFKYCAETRYLFRDSITLDWDSLVRTNLDARKPLYYAGWEDTTFTSGHAFVCDGYQDSAYYHFNWGWGGYDDGYFYSSNLNPSGYNFNICQELIVDIYPDTINYTYPLHCSQDTITYSSGTFTSGNGIKTYLPNADCSWLIHPECGSSVQLQFNTFDLAQGDSLFVFDGENEQAGLIQVFTNQNFPILVGNTPTTSVKSTSNNIFIKFTTDNSNEGYGFNISYSSKYCNLDTLSAVSGTFSDGSGDCDYNNSTTCRWVIYPPNAQALSISFNQFELENSNTSDYILIYKNVVGSSNLMANLNSANPPTGPIYIPAGKAIIRFVTNSSLTAAGWEATYEDVTTVQPVENQKFNVFPNPVNEQTSIVSNEPITYVVLTDISGKVIAEKQINSSTQVSLTSISKHLTAGIYFCKTNLGNIKLICTEDF